MNDQRSRLDPSVRRMLLVLLVVYIFNFLDRQIVNILAEPIGRDLKLSDTQLGLMTGLAFALFYTVLGLPIARYADRPTTDRGRLIAAALTIWSGMTALCGLAQNYVQLLMARIGVGVGEAGCTPAAHSLIADRVPPDRRPGAMAFYALGIPVGSLLGMMIGGYLADTLGWRKAFTLVGLPGIVMAVIVLLLVKDKGRAKAGPVSTQGGVGMFSALGQLLRSPAYLLLLAGASASSFLSYGKATWTTIFFQRSYGMSPGEVGFTFGLWGGLAGALGTWLGGWLADRYGRHDRRHIVTAPAIGMALAVPIAIAAYQSTDWRISLLLLMIPSVLNSLYYGPVYSSAQGLVPLHQRATSSALLLFGQNLIGLGLGPLFFGMLSDWLKPEYGADSVRYVLYGAALLGLLPAALYWQLGKRLNAELDRHG
ncbi:MFS transporter [Novosphingobium sp.]|uniref:spinster family MFS transporter n=1 Tax=Novosphingobium sp. TaxID=1874826 RepID=UPI0025E6E0E5|nr:MFS transporter [Novosphingobium sp.]